MRTFLKYFLFVCAVLMFGYGQAFANFSSEGNGSVHVNQNQSVAKQGQHNSFITKGWSHSEKEMPVLEVSIAEPEEENAHIYDFKKQLEGQYYYISAICFALAIGFILAEKKKHLPFSKCHVHLPSQKISVLYQVFRI
ncbi:hypothetical protein [Mangrovimonas sp. TPBH4]|uniref:hypothetical protein n=1 Tax=Mangrovimonas sp. TPBH4 TaxID=1645914 RepID=UPI0012FC99AD|nr:hypothetical protein [Mangrovimonas sp. TPBH4]